jgi:hypothetical protein
MLQSGELKLACPEPFGSFGPPKAQKTSNFYFTSWHENDSFKA